MAALGWLGAHLDIQAKAIALFAHNARQIVHAELLCELVEHSELACSCRVVDGQLHTAHLPPCMRVHESVSECIQFCIDMQQGSAFDKPGRCSLLWQVFIHDVHGYLERCKAQPYQANAACTPILCTYQAHL